MPEGPEKLYFIGLIAPRGPQIPVYGMQTKLVARMIALHEAGGPARVRRLDRYLGALQETETRIDIVRAVWNDQMADTERLLDAFAEASPALAGEWAVA